MLWLGAILQEALQQVCMIETDLNALLTQKSNEGYKNLTLSWTGSTRNPFKLQINNHRGNYPTNAWSTNKQKRLASSTQLSVQFMLFLCDF